MDNVNDNVNDNEKLIFGKKKKKNIIKENIIEELYTYDVMLKRMPCFIFNGIQGIQGIQDNKLNLPLINLTFKNRRTFFKNINDICRILNRNIEDLKKFIDTEFGTISTIKENGILSIKNNIKSQEMEKCIRQFIKCYVICRQCKSFQTQIRNKYNFECLNCKFTFNMKLMKLNEKF